VQDYAGHKDLRTSRRYDHSATAWTATPPHLPRQALAVAGLLGSLWEAGALEQADALADRAAADFSLNDLDLSPGCWADHRTFTRTTPWHIHTVGQSHAGPHWRGKPGAPRQVRG